MCALILWRSGLGLLIGQFCQFLRELSVRDMSVFLFPDDNFSQYQWIFIKQMGALVLWRPGLGLLMGKFRQFLTELSAQDTSVFSFLNDN